jgi:hypothetical protein
MHGVAANVIHVNNDALRNHTILGNLPTGHIVIKSCKLGGRMILASSHYSTESTLLAKWVGAMTHRTAISGFCQLLTVDKNRLHQVW